MKSYNTQKHTFGSSQCWSDERKPTEDLLKQTHSILYMGEDGESVHPGVPNRPCNRPIVTVQTIKRGGSSCGHSQPLYI